MISSDFTWFPISGLGEP